MKLLRRAFPVSVSLLAGALRASAQLSADILVDPRQDGVAVDSRFHGVFLEEINHGVDGGLYAELLANRGFEDSRPPEGCVERADGAFVSAQGWDSGFRQPPPGTIPRWQTIAEAQDAGGVELLTSGGLNTNSPYCVRLSANAGTTGRVAIANTGYWGISVRPGEVFRLSLHAQAEAAACTQLVVRLEAPDGTPCSTEIGLTPAPATNRWQRFEGILSGTADRTDARLVIALASPGAIRLDFISLFPFVTFMERPNGMRSDLAQMIADLHPGFIRFPGGCVVEGGNVATAYDWRETIGPVEQRRERWNDWGHRRTHGLGFFEYLRFCTDLGAAPLYVGFAGQSCLYRQSELVPMSNMPPVAQGLVDALRFANEPATGRWGSVRATMGRAEPFRMDRVEIGNENAGPEYEERYRLIRKAVAAAHPGVRTIADYAITDADYDLADEHYYNTPEWFFANSRLFDRRPRPGTPVYVGEYAVTGGSPAGCLRAALAEAAFALGCERNGDIVKMMSYAPLLAHEMGRSGWHGIINFDSRSCYGFASYHAQKMLADHRPDLMVDVTTRVAGARAADLHGGAGVGTWHTQAEFSRFQVESAGRTLFDTRTGGADAWQFDGGSWSNRGVTLIQSGEDEPAQAAVKGLDATNFTIHVRARKTGGDEGFLILFATREGMRSWWNIGGWRNREHGLEFQGASLGDHVPGSIELGRDYDIRIEVAGRSIRCFLDDKLIHDVVAPAPEPIYVNAGRTLGQQVIVKAVNADEEAAATRIQIDGRNDDFTARWTCLTSSDWMDNNSLAEPRKVMPVVQSAQASNGVLNVVLPARSFNGFLIEPPAAAP